MEKQVNTILLVGASWRAFDDASTTCNILALTIYRTVKQKMFAHILTWRKISSVYHLKNHKSNLIR